VPMTSLRLLHLKIGLHSILVGLTQDLRRNVLILHGSNSTKAQYTNQEVTVGHNRFIAQDQNPLQDWKR
jgi:hypothetical protein